MYTGLGRLDQRLRKRGCIEWPHGAHLIGLIDFLGAGAHPLSRANVLKAETLRLQRRATIPRQHSPVGPRHPSLWTPTAPESLGVIPGLFHVQVVVNAAGLGVGLRQVLDRAEAGEGQEAQKDETGEQSSVSRPYRNQTWLREPDRCKSRHE